MRNLAQALQQSICVLSFIAIVNIAQGQNSPVQLKIKDFAVWGGSAAPTTYNNSQGVFIGNIVSIQGNVGSNHLVDAKNLFNVTGNIYSGNVVSLGNIGKVTGNIFAAKTAASYTGNVISGDYKINFTGNLTANGKIFLKNQPNPFATNVTGQVAVPAPSATNYSGPVPTAGIVNVVTLPLLPTMPNNTAFDSQVGTTNITSTQTISPGKYKKMALTGNKILTFNGPGNYIFNEVDNDVTANKLLFDFKNTTTGSINIYIIKDAKWGRLSVKTVNGNFPDRIYTEIHGSGTTTGCGGNAFNIIGPVSMPDNSYVWLGNIWAPNGGISFKSMNPFNTPHVLGALWSAKKVELDQNLKLVYQAAAVGTGPGYIDPYYPPPANGKVATANNIIGAELTSLSQNTSTITSIPENEIFILNGAGKVMIEVISKAANDATLKSQLINLGMSDTVNNGPGIYIITGFFPINKLTQLNSNTRIDYVRPLFPPISNTGQVTSQGDLTMRSNSVRDRFGLDGTGVKIGVISDSYDAKQGAQTDVNEGDLPGIKTSGELNANPEPVQVVEDLAGRGNDEGRAMLQIVHDVAPKAKLAFSTGFVSAGQFAKAIQKLASPTLPGGPCDIIVDDLTYLAEPFQRDGIVAQAVNQAVAQGVTYVTSAGNFGNKSYEAVFNGVTNTSIIAGQIHKFGPNAADIYQSLNLKPGSYTIALQWSDEFTSLGNQAGVLTDLDLYLVGNNGLQLFGFNRSNLSGDPLEVCAFTVKDTTIAKLMIVRAAGTANVRFKYIIFRGDATIMDYQTGTSSIVGHSNATGAITVGAMLYADIPPFTPIWPGVASFSSRGGTFTLQGTTFSARNKPDLVGPNGVNTTVNLGGAPFNDGDTYPNFFGTSAAAPHVAAVGALILQGRKKYNLQTTVTPAQIRQQLQTSAGKFPNLSGTFTFEGGYGYVQADSAVSQIANARPVISTLEAVVPGAQNGTQPFDVKMTGKYIAGNAKINVNNVPYTTTVTVDPATGIGTAIATVPAIPIGQDPAFEVVNPAKSISGLDGGRSETLRFFSSGIKILVKAQNKSRKYGQENPAFGSQVSVVIGSDTTDISQTSLTLADLKLDNLVFGTNAVPNSSPRGYGISIARATPLPANDPLLATYTFVFQPGTLLVEKMPLKITANGKTLKYGDDVSGFTYQYELDQSGVLSSSLLEEVKSLHTKYLADNGLIVLHGFNTQDTAQTAIVTNMGAMASFQSVLNARKFLSVNGQLQEQANPIPASQIADQRFIVDVSAQSMLNYKLDHTQSAMVDALPDVNARALLNIKALTSGNAKAAVPGGEFQAMLNGQLLAMVNGQLQALVNGQLKALVNSVYVDATDMVFENGQLKALVNSIWVPITNGQLLAIVNGAQVTVDLSVTNGQLQALVNGVPMTLVNGQLQAIVNGQLLAIVNGQLKALVNTQLTPLVNGQLMAIVNEQLEPMNNGQLVAIVNGQLMVLENNELEAVQDLLLLNGQLQALVNGQLKALVNGQLKALVNGVVTDVPTTNFNLVNGQLQALVNGQLVAYANGQLQALVNGQLKALVNGSAVSVQSVTQLANGQLKALVNGSYIPIANGQLQALVNGQLLAMVNGQLMAIVNGELTFVVFQNGQLKALVNGQLQALVNGQLKAIVNGELTTVNSYSIVNGQLQAIVNGETWVYPNGQLKALVNGQLQPLVNNFDVSGTNNNANTVVLVDENDINLQSGDVGGMFSMNMVTGLEAGDQWIIPGAFVNENFDVTYGPALLRITRKPLVLTAENKIKNAGEPNPPMTITYSGFAFNDGPASLCQPLIIPPTTKSIDQLERRTTYTNVLINGSSNEYYATPGESLILTGNWSEVYFSDIIPGYIPYCPGCITQNYIGMTNDNFTGNNFDICYDVSGTFAHTGAINNTFTAPTRPGVYYITQVSNWWFYCYQFGHMLNDQVAKDAIAVVIVNPAGSISGNTTATDTSTAGDYPIIIGGCYFNSNYRIAFQDGTLTVNDPIIPITTNNGRTANDTKTTSNTKKSNDPKTVNETKTSQTGQKEAAAAVSIKADLLYPNPASSVLRLQLKDDVQTANDIKLYDGVGKTTPTYFRKVSEGLYEINVSGLANGIYIIEARTAGGVKTFKFMKM